MLQAPFTLDDIRVASPCRASWEAMAGDDRVRFCGQCGHNVYNLSGMSRSEGEALVETHEGRLCVRYFRRQDGTILTADCPVGLRAARRRLLWLFSVAAGLLLTVLGWAAVRLGAANDREEADVRLRDVQPFKAILNLINPEPPNLPPPEIMGKMCAPPAPRNPG